MGGGIVFYRVAGQHLRNPELLCDRQKQLKIGNPKASRPKIVVIVCDDMGFSDIGCCSREIDKPNLNSLAADAIRVVDFHNHAKCSETRASLMTGLWHRQSRNLKAPDNATLA